MTDFDLRSEIRDVLDSTSLTDPREIAEKVAENIPAKLRLAVLKVALVPLVQNVNQRSRSNGPILGSNTGPTHSAKVTAIREAWRAALHDRIHVAPAPGEWKLLGDCTYADLMFAAEERRQQAATNAAKAERYAALAELLHTHGVSTVGELPVDALASTLTERAA